MRKRFKAVWDTPGIAGWATRQAAKSVWRTFPLYDFDELLAEAQYCFSKCKDKYERKVDKPAHFAALFRRTFCNRITDLANLRTERQSTGFNASELHADTDLMDCFQGRYSATETADLLLDFEGAPAPVLSMLKEILEGQPAEISPQPDTGGELLSDYQKQVLLIVQKYPGAGPFNICELLAKENYPQPHAPLNLQNAERSLLALYNNGWINDNAALTLKGRRYLSGIACNDWLCRALQLPPGTDLVGAFMARLRPAV